jgi:hypothetical protein
MNVPRNDTDETCQVRVQCNVEVMVERVGSALVVDLLQIGATDDSVEYRENFLKRAGLPPCVPVRIKRLILLSGDVRFDDRGNLNRILRLRLVNVAAHGRLGVKVAFNIEVDESVGDCRDVTQQDLFPVGAAGADDNVLKIRTIQFFPDRSDGDRRTCSL